MSDGKTTFYSLDLRGRKIKLNAPIEVSTDAIYKAVIASEGIELPQEEIDLFADVIEALNDKIKEKKDES